MRTPALLTPTVLLLMATLTHAQNLATVEQNIVEQINEFRQSQGRSSVEVDRALQATAEDFARYMAETGRYGHGADGRTPAQRVTAHGYEYCLILENIGYSFDSTGFTQRELVEGFVQGWINSPDHRRNLVDPDVVETGVALARNGNTFYAVQLLGRPKSMQIVFQLVNRTPRKLEYTLDGETFPLPPRYTRTYYRCRPPQLTFEDTGRTIHVEHGDQFVITAGGNGDVRITQERFDPSHQ